jgi:hypothetical protein
MISRQVRSTSRRITIELLVVATLSGFGPTFPVGVSGSGAWAFVAHHPAELLHVLGGFVVFVESAVFVVRLFTATAGATVRTAAAIGACAAALSCSSGSWFVLGGQPATALGTMTAGWLAALAAQICLWVMARRQLRREDRALTPSH